MSGLPLGSRQTPPCLDGVWVVWSKADDAPGAYFITPVDETARAVGVKYAVIRAIQSRNESRPRLSLIRTDPARPDLLEKK
jgi:hypothetical protein